MIFLTFSKLKKKKKALLPQASVLLSYPLNGTVETNMHQPEIMLLF